MPSASAPRTNPRPLKTDFRLLRKDEMQTPCPVVAVLLASAQADEAIPAPGRRVLLASPPRLRWRRHRPRAPPLSSCADSQRRPRPGVAVLPASAQAETFISVPKGRGSVDG